MNLQIPQIQGLRGERQIPGDKSISHRALMIGSISDGVSEIRSCSRAADPMSTLSCVRQLGLDIEDLGDRILIHGKGRRGLVQPSTPLDAGNSGTTMRLFSGILSGQKFASTIVGDSSLSRRPMKRILDPLRLMGANIQGSKENTAPLIIQPVEQLNAISYNLPVPSAQVKSALIFAGLYARGETTIQETVKTRDHSERMLGLRTSTKEGLYIVEIHPGIRVEGKKFFVPGDMSAAAFLLAAGLLVPGSNLRIQNVGLNPTRRRILDILKSMGGNITIENERVVAGEPLGDLNVKYSDLQSDLELGGSEIVDIIDEIPILAVTCLFAEGSLRIRDAQELRAKETDRISAIVDNLRRMGVLAEEYQDGFAFEGKQKMKGGVLPSYGDHRIAMSFGIASLRIPDSTIEGAECVEISYPGFWKDLLS